jgi:hypothetical protein
VPAAVWRGLELPRCCGPCRTAAFEALQHALAVDAFRTAEELLAEAQSPAEVARRADEHCAWLVDWMRHDSALGSGLAILLDAS